jgi:hypothetical protein
MRVAIYRIRVGRLSRGLLCGLLLLGQAVATFGYPVLSAARPSAGSCQERACGCPEELHAKRACCCTPTHEETLPACCAKKRSCCAPKETQPEPAQAPKQWHWVLAFAAPSCGGETPSGMLAAEPAVVVVELPPAAPAAPRVDVLSIHSESAVPLPVLPPTPPPRLG